MITSILLSFALTAPMLDVRVDGEGYLRFVRDGRAVYAKSAKLRVTAGSLANEQGDSVLPPIEIGPGATRLSVDLEGNVTADYPSGKVKAGQLVLATFSTAATFEKEGGVLVASEKPHLGNPGDDTLGVIRMVSSAAEPHVVEAASTHPAGDNRPQPFVIPTGLAAKLSNRTAQNASPAKQVGISITVHDRSVVDSDHIMLGSIATIEGDPKFREQFANVDLGETPAVGVSRVIDRAHILARIRASGLRPEDCIVIVPEDTQVRRKGDTIPASQFVTVAVQALLSKGGPVGTWQCTDNFSDLEVPSGHVDLRAQSMTGVQTGDAAVIIGVYVNDNYFNSRTLHLHLHDAVPPIKPGSIIKLVLISGGAELETPAIARTGGRLGDTIQVEVKTGSPSITTYQTGIMTGANTVEVRL